MANEEAGAKAAALRRILDQTAEELHAQCRIDARRAWAMAALVAASLWVYGGYVAEAVGGAANGAIVFGALAVVALQTRAVLIARARAEALRPEPAPVRRG